MLDFPATFTAIASALKIVKELNEIDRKLDQAGLKLRIAELSGALSRANMTLAEAQQALVEKDKEIAGLKRSFALAADLVEHDGYHYRKNSEGQPQGRPVCPRCHLEGRLILTTVTDLDGRPVQCPECQRNYYAVLEFA
jgi:hypothetical protein